jgi:hypothetical protein
VREVDRPLHGGDHRDVRQGLHPRTGLRRTPPLPTKNRRNQSGSQRNFVSGEITIKLI